MEHANTFKLSVVGFFGALTALFGWFGWMVIVFFACMILDYITGSLVAAKNGNWTSGEAKSGIFSKVGMIVAVITGGLADFVLGLIINNIPSIGLPFTYTVLFCPMVVAWYILTELGSIIENAGDLGAPVPEFLRKALKKFRDSIDSAGDKLTDNKSG